MGVCELCGKGGIVSKAKIEGIAMEVCSGCSKFGSAIRAPPQVRNFRMRKKQELFDIKENVDVLVPDYNHLIKIKREKLGLKQEHLAKKMGIKESMLHKIESSRLRPSIDLAKRFEKTLGINLFSIDNGEMI